MCRKKFLAVLIDLSGTLHIGNTSTPSAVAALQRLRNSSLKLLFVTNTTKESGSHLKRRLDSIGFDIKAEEIFSSLSAAQQLVKSRQYRPMLLLQASAKEEFAGLEETDPNAVVVGLAPDCFDYLHMNAAFRLINEGAHLIAVHAGRYYKEEDGLSLGPGPFVKALEYATGVTAEVVGKPVPGFFHAALKQIDCVPEDAVMIGDDVRDDVAGAQAAGMSGVLVRTGKYRPGDEDTVSPPPAATFDNFALAVEWLLQSAA
ncbi:HAD-superfamily hydrolase LHPP/HDHD2 [Trinorchestia longiramus]|nr:HAD-superfamily hydrolase LHPP/HDHD2 [Trinorchestia longiramus]